MANIQFSYLYRDAGNYKRHNDIVFANRDDIDIEHLEKLIRSKLLEGLWFLADEWLLPDLHFEDFNIEMDHPYHEFKSITYTTNSADFSVSLYHWMADIQNQPKVR